MPGIVCAIRGGPDSQPTIEKSIEVAIETGQPIYFLYVVNLDFLTHTASSRVHIITEEMEELGDFILKSAQAEAKDKGAIAEAIIRHGKVGNMISAVCHELGADYVVLGRPRGKSKKDVFTHEQLVEYAQQVKELTGAEVVFAGKDEA
jgi:nucleotide-binding universal stress UspA family protein